MQNQLTEIEQKIVDYLDLKIGKSRRDTYIDIFGNSQVDKRREKILQSLKDRGYIEERPYSDKHAYLFAL